MYKKSILNEYSFILPKKLVVSDAELYKRRKENLSVLRSHVYDISPESLLHAQNKMYSSP